MSEEEEVDPFRNRKYVRIVWCVALTKLAIETILATALFVGFASLGFRLFGGMFTGILEFAWIFAVYRMIYVRLKDPKSMPEHYRHWKDSKPAAWYFFTEVMGS